MTDPIDPLRSEQRASRMRIWAAAITPRGTALGLALGLQVLAFDAGAQTPVSAPPSGAAVAVGPAYAPVAIEDVTVIDVRDGRRLPHQTVVVVDRRIQAVGPAGAPLPAGVWVVSGRGQYLMPGLWDMHMHTHMPDALYPLLIANGITGIRDVGAFELGLDTMKWWRREISAGRRVGPRQPIILGQKLQDGQEWTAERARYVIDSTKAAGAEFFKLHVWGEMPRESYFALLAEARRVGLPVVGHLPWSVSALEASDSGQRTIEHISWVVFDGLPCPGDSEANGLLAQCQGSKFPRGHWLGACDGDSATVETCSRLAQRFRRNGTWFTPTLVHQYYPDAPWSHRPIISQLPYLDSTNRQVRPFERESFNPDGQPFSKDSAYGAVLSLMARAGMPILTGTDVILGTATVHEELALLVEKGFTPLAALQAATLNPAQYLGVADSLGAIAPGYLADLVLLGADPLLDIRHTAQVRAVVADGRYFDRTALDSLLADVDRRVRAGR